jgi:mannose-6-phosphate isomerase-like protein (cupin superfamily)
MNAQMNAQSLLVPHGKGTSVWLLGDLYAFKISSEALSVVELSAFSQNGPPPHIHLREDESFWVLDGEFSVLLGEQALTVGPGAFVHVPRGTLHTYKNVGRTPGRLVVMLTPGGFENLWKELGVPATQHTAPPAAQESDVIQRLMTLAPRYHLQVPPPPQ